MFQPRLLETKFADRGVNSFNSIFIVFFIDFISNLQKHTLHVQICKEKYIQRINLNPMRSVIKHKVT